MNRINKRKCGFFLNLFIKFMKMLVWIIIIKQIIYSRQIKKSKNKKYLVDFMDKNEFMALLSNGFKKEDFQKSLF